MVIVIVRTLGDAGWDTNTNGAEIRLSLLFFLCQVTSPVALCICDSVLFCLHFYIHNWRFGDYREPAGLSVYRALGCCAPFSLSGRPDCTPA